MVTDQEPRYRLVDADGNVVGSLFAESDGTLKLQEGTSGNDNELSLTTQGALEVEQLAVGGQPSDLHWEEDPNSPLDFSGQPSGSITLANSYERVKVLFVDTGSLRTISLRVNGDTGDNYQLLLSDDSTTTADGVELAAASDGLQGQSMDLAGNWGTAEKFVASLPLTGVDQSQPIAAENGNVTGPLSEITLFNPNGNNISAKAKVFGR